MLQVYQICSRNWIKTALKFYQNPDPYEVDIFQKNSYIFIETYLLSSQKHHVH
jgi:hypothetical protein